VTRRAGGRDETRATPTRAAATTGRSSDSDAARPPRPPRPGDHDARHCRPSEARARRDYDSMIPSHGSDSEVGPGRGPSRSHLDSRPLG
jgi:hypothetical protein